MPEVFAPYKWAALAARWPDIAAAFATTVGVSLLALVIALALGAVFGMLSVSRAAVLRALVRIYVEVVQNVPLLLQVFVFYAIFPLVGFSLAAFWIGVLSLGIYHGGYMAEVVRSGVGSISRGQFEAAKSQGFSYRQTLTLVVLPQAFRIILPPLAVQAANLVKNTSVLALIAGGELMYFANSFAGSTSYYGPAYVVAAVLYFAVCFPLSRLALHLERRARKEGHADATGPAAEASDAESALALAAFCEQNPQHEGCEVFRGSHANPYARPHVRRLARATARRRKEGDAPGGADDAGTGAGAGSPADTGGGVQDASSPSKGKGRGGSHD